MANDQTIVMTSSGVEVIVTLLRSDTAVVLDATAIPSELTHRFDAAYERALQRWLDESARRGVRVAGAPPLSGAHVMLAEIRVTPPQAMRAIGREIQGTGGTGSEWTVQWSWDLSGIESVDGDLLVESEVDAMRVPVPPK